MILENTSFPEKECNSYHNVALFVDNDNIQKSCFKAINESYDFDVLINECNKYGRVILSKIYLDTTRLSSKQYELYRRGFETVYAPCFPELNGGIRKSLTDPMIMKGLERNGLSKKGRG